MEINIQVDEVLERLYRLSKRYRMYESEKMKNNVLDDIRLIAGVAGYSVAYWQQTGEWVRVETVSNGLLKPFETVLKTEREVVETANKPFNGSFEAKRIDVVETVVRLETVEKIEAETIKTAVGKCEACNNKLEGRAKRFCSVRCKNDYNNAKRKGL